MLQPPSLALLLIILLLELLLMPLLMLCGIPWRLIVVAWGAVPLACEKYEPNLTSNVDIRFDSMPGDDAGFRAVAAAVVACFAVAFVRHSSSAFVDEADDDESDDKICSISLEVASNGTDSMASKLWLAIFLTGRAALLAGAAVADFFAIAAANSDFVDVVALLFVTALGGNGAGIGGGGGGLIG